ncbi:hypothetical protein QN277_006163 [Acacia crassicarpa]|uniref:Uncharacterized protein n=1 Tax=Acacia crassicarpa TaxID=499986 RepID=A0AAE1IXR1_9FABA|nr:hypothetical protein QN277_006163 [Acacia crassicarpa]
MESSRYAKFKIPNPKFLPFLPFTRAHLSESQLLRPHQASSFPTEFHPHASSSRICQIDAGERSYFRLFLCSGLRRIPELSVSLPELLSRLSYLLRCVGLQI